MAISAFLLHLMINLSVNGLKVSIKRHRRLYRSPVGLTSRLGRQTTNKNKKWNKISGGQTVVSAVERTRAGVGGRGSRRCVMVI